MPISGSCAWSVAVTDSVYSLCVSRSKLCVVVMTPGKRDTPCSARHSLGTEFAERDRYISRARRISDRTQHNHQAQSTPTLQCVSWTRPTPTPLSLLPSHVICCQQSTAFSPAALIRSFSLSTLLSHSSRITQGLSPPHREASLRFTPAIVQVTEYFKDSSLLLWGRVTPQKAQVM